MGTPQNPDFDYIVIGSGAGGGPVAANLARNGYKVGLIEAGTRAENPSYLVPVFHPFASEDPDTSWEFFVRHYESLSQSERDNKFLKDKDGVFYPRAGTLGGCTAHHAMITIVPSKSDFQYIADLTGDDTWAPDNMYQYFTRLERCGYVKDPAPGPNPSRHGYKGWLSTTGLDYTLALGDPAVLQTVIDASLVTWKEITGGVLPQLPQDPNNWSTPDMEGLIFPPLATLQGRRAGTRELIQMTQDAYPQNLVIRMSNLATRILFDANKRAIGVETWEGQHLYRADPNADGNDDYEVKQYYCSQEVILAGGAFNSPQLLMLSGIGPADHLKQFGIPVVADRPGVGTNLQDRYEIGIISEMKRNWKVIEHATFEPPLPNQPGDPCYTQWQDGSGVYTTNGALVAVIKKSTPQRPVPDLFLFALAGHFRGYYPGYSKDVERTKNFLTWAVLKAHTNNNAGSVRLKSKDPRDRPLIDFKYFEEGNDVHGADLDAVVEGVKFAREVSKNNSAIKGEVYPGPDVQSDADIRQFVKDNAWGHHASCTNPMGKATDSNAVVDSNFKVIGVDGLRVVDASVFPRIPGFFIVTPIYMIAEKASDVIMAAAKR
ncbi:MAG TPA: GMC family oxidoreductase [Thermoanaerobaculia bacterium]|jgi:choline dehydrogenase|nr:GMC family oxidoreductase [Thermoanaerobaculia bacterium]